MTNWLHEFITKKDSRTWKRVKDTGYYELNKPDFPFSVSTENQINFDNTILKCWRFHVYWYSPIIDANPRWKDGRVRENGPIRITFNEFEAIIDGEQVHTSFKNEDVMWFPTGFPNSFRFQLQVFIKNLRGVMQPFDTNFFSNPVDEITFVSQFSKD